MLHFVPLVGMEGYEAPIWPLMKAAWPALDAVMNTFIQQEGTESGNIG